jgi:hypothetical protein
MRPAAGIFVILLMAFAGGTLVAAAYEAISDEARGDMDPTW